MSTKKVLFEGTAQRVIMPGEAGVFEICLFHKPLLSRLLPGRTIIDNQVFEIKHGVVKVEDNQVTAIVASKSEN